jgi:hypothetical protein
MRSNAISSRDSSASFSRTIATLKIAFQPYYTGSNQEFAYHDDVVPDAFKLPHPFVVWLRLQNLRVQSDEEGCGKETRIHIFLFEMRVQVGQTD